MALFKPFRGTRATLPQELHDGYAYFCTDDGSFHIDYVDADDNLQRKQINAKDAETLMGKSLVELQSDWSVNNETNPAYIKNRPFYTTDPQEVVLCDGTYDFSNDPDSGTSLYMTNPGVTDEHFKSPDNQQVNIVYDGTEYNFTSKYLAAMDNYYVGNGSLFNAVLGSNEVDTGESFAYLLAGFFITSDTDTQHTIRISVSEIMDITIPHKYLGVNIWTGDDKYSVVANTDQNIASGYVSFASGYKTIASGDYSHTEGTETIASGINSHAEGNDTEASNYNAHAEGSNTVASGHSSHAEGSRTVASAETTHAEGRDTKASAWNAHSEGQGTEAAGRSQHVFGEYNIVDGSTSGVSQRAKYIQIAGNGGSANARSNAHTLDWSGNAWFAGDVKVGGTGQDDENAKVLATTEYVDSKAVQPDWSMHDENSPMYIKNRTHWSKISQTEILPECQLEGDEDGYLTIVNKIEAVVGHTYIINWNGASYTCVARLFNGQIGVGNGSVIGEPDTGEPFLIGFYPDYMAAATGCYAVIMPFDGSTTCTISIIEQIEDIHKLDNKYLSDEVLAKHDWNASEGNLGHILNRTHYTEEVLEEIIQETTVTFGAATDPGRDTGTATGSATQIYPNYGEMFVIEWNGTKYYSIARSYTKEDGSFGKGVGNTGMFGGAMYPEYPFLVGFLTEKEAATAGHTYFVWVNDGSTTATFSVGKVGEAVHKLDAKYLPENIATEDYVDTAITATKPKMATITLPVANWTGSTNPWSQVVTVNGVTANSKVDLQPSAQQIVSLQNSETILMASNDGGTVTFWAIGTKPTVDYTMQVLITEVTYV